MFVSLGVSGAWIGRLTALSPYQPIFLLASTVFLGMGFWKTYRRGSEICDPDSLCAKPNTHRATMAILWIGVLFTGAAFAVDLLPFFG